MICIDTPILIWSLQGIAEPDAQDMPARMARYIDSLDQKDEEILIPAPVVTEYLAGLKSHAKREEERNRLVESFFIPAVDVPVSCLAADLMAKQLGSTSKKNNTSNPHLMTTALIAATAIIHKADLLITDAPSRYIKLVKNQLQVEEIPNLATQKMLF